MRCTLKKKYLLLTIGLIALSAISAKAQLIAYEGFAYTAGDTLTNASLNGAGDSFGWAAPWGGANIALATNQAGSLTYSDPNGNTLQTDGGKVILGVPGGTATSAQITRSFVLGSLNGTRYSGPTNSPSVYWASFMMQWVGPTTAGSSTNQFVRKGDIVFRGGATTNAPGGGTEFLDIGSPNAGNTIGRTPDVFSMWRGPDAGNGVLNTGLGTTTVPLNNSTFVLVKFVLDGTNGFDTAYMWLNWTNLTIEPDIALASATNNSGNMDGFNNIRLDANGGNAAGTNTVIAFDEFRLGQTFGDVSVVPEPTVVTLATIGGLSVLALVRRRRNFRK
jgi:hypothetical protein